jgi:cholest-4-en-3-one 26-monooxygenase
MTTTEAINIVDPAIYEQGIPHETFRWMRNNTPVYRHEYSDGDFWAVTRYNDVIQVTRDWKTFSSAKKMVNLWDLSDEAMEARRSIIESDPPIHARLRKLAMLEPCLMPLLIIRMWIWLQQFHRHFQFK